MKLSLSLTLALLSMAALVGLAGYFSGGALRDTVVDLEDMRDSSIQELARATGMLGALQEAQRAAQELIAERYRSRVEAAHDSEWGISADIEVDAIESSLERFQELLDAGGRVDQTLDGQRERLTDIGREFAVHRALVVRLIHLARYHPSDHVSEFVEEELRPHYRSRMLPLIREYEREANRALEHNLAEIQTSLAAAKYRNRLLALAALGAAVILAIWMGRAISRPLERLRQAAVRVGAGDLAHPVDVTSHNEIGEVSEAFNQMISSLRAITVSRTELDDILQSIGEMLLVTDESGRIRAFNQAAAEELGLAEYEPDDRLVQSLIEVEEGDANGEAAEAGRGIARRRDGSEIPILCTSSPLRSPDGQATGRVWVARDISQELEAERELEKSLSEKEILLKEVHHRVKNNLQIISSLLSLQGKEDDELAHRLRDCQNRILSMAILHEQLYRSEDLARIEFADYAQQLVDRVVRSHGSRSETVRTHLAMGPAMLTLDQAIPCGMVLTELISNAIEHAFPDGVGEIWIAFEVRNGTHHLTVRDNGVGLATDFDPASSESLGLQLVMALAEQLEGDLTWVVEEGTAFSLTYRGGTPQSGQGR